MTPEEANKKLLSIMERFSSIKVSSLNDIIDGINKINIELEELQEECPHANIIKHKQDEKSEYEEGGSPFCNDCGKDFI